VLSSHVITHSIILFSTSFTIAIYLFGLYQIYKAIYLNSESLSSQQNNDPYQVQLPFLVRQKANLLKTFFINLQNSLEKVYAFKIDCLQLNIK